MSAAGDVNADGVDDLLIGAYGANANGSGSGASYVVFGGAGVGSSGIVELSALDGTSGFVLNGVAVSDYSGRSVSAAGDVNADAVEAMLVGAWMADPNGSRSGASYVVFGDAAGPGATLTGITGQRATCINSTTGKSVVFPLEGSAAWDCGWKGLAVNAGDPVDTFLDGIAAGGPQLAGTAFGFDPGPMLTVCQNATTGQSVPIPHPGGTGWNCEPAGLAASAGNVVRVIVRGIAK